MVKSEIYAAYTKYFINDQGRLYFFARCRIFYMIISESTPVKMEFLVP